MSDLTMEQLNEKINNLSNFVEKQSALISKTGQQLIEMQVKNVKQSMNNIDVKDNNKNQNIDLSDYVNNEDIVQLVGELQGQLDSLEERSINRLINSKCKQDDDKIVAITNKDGEVIEGVLPQTVKQFKELSKQDVVKLAEFYELILPDSDNVNQFLEDNEAKTVEQAHEKFKYAIESQIDKFSEDDIKAIKHDIARYLGLVNFID